MKWRKALLSSHVAKVGGGMEPQRAGAESSAGGRDRCGMCEDKTRDGG